METSFLVEQVTFGGKGLGRLDRGKVCFVPFVIPGERVSVRIEKEKSSYAEASLVRVLEASADRVKAPCPVFGQCGGCQYQHMAYSRQLAVKKAQVEDVLRRLGGIAEAPVADAVGSPQEYAYRNRITVHVRGGKVGFFGEKSDRLVEVIECPIASPKVNELLRDLRKAPPRDGEYPLRERGEFRGFRQVNAGAAEGLLAKVRELAAPGGGLLVDAYSGAGFFARGLRDLFQNLVGIEWSIDAVRAAREQATESESYLLGDVGEHLLEALGSGPAADTTLLLDPPAEGVDPRVVDLIRFRMPRRVIYVSCNPATLARDFKKLRDQYRLVRAVPIDMFPQTAEIEVAALFEQI